MKKKEIKQRRIQIAIIIVMVILIIVYMIYGIIQLIKNPTGTFVVETGKISKEETAQGYIIRDEEVITGKNYKNGIAQIKAEGERVSKGESIYRYYTNGEENLIKKIQELDIKIQEAWEKDNTSMVSPDILPDIKLIESRMEQKLNNVYKLNNIQKINEYKNEINSYITKKAKIAGELSPAGSYLKTLINQRSEYENRLNFGSEYITAPRAGVVSYRVDGLEAVLTPDSFQNLNKDILEKLNLKTGQIVSMSVESGKIIDNYECYIACIVDSEEGKNAVVGENVTLRISGEYEIKAEIEYTAKQSKTENLIIFKIDKYVNELISYRKISMDIVWWQSSGWKVPNLAIKQFKDDLYYVVRERMGYKDKIYIKLLTQTEDYSIIENYTAKELEEKIESMKTGNEEEDKKLEEISDNFKKISIYDEIVI